MMKCRTVTIDDVANVSDFFESVSSDMLPSMRSGWKERVQTYLQTGNIVLCEMPQPVGAMAYWCDNKELFVGMTVIASEYRKSPVFWEMIRFVYEQEKSKQWLGVSLWTSPDNEPVLSIVERFNGINQREFDFKGTLQVEYYFDRKAVDSYFSKQR